MDRSQEEELRILIQRLARRIRSNRGDDSLSPTAFSVLVHVEREPGATPGRLAELEHVRPPSMNRTINGLEGAGYVTRSPSPDDARKVQVHLTEAGRELLEETRRLRRLWFTSRINELDSGEQARLVAALPVLRKLADT